MEGSATADIRHTRISQASVPPVSVPTYQLHPLLLPFAHTQDSSDCNCA
jgi:hypothetical protein